MLKQILKVIEVHSHDYQFSYTAVKTKKHPKLLSTTLWMDKFSSSTGLKYNFMYLEFSFPALFFYSVNFNLNLIDTSYLAGYVLQRAKVMHYNINLMIRSQQICYLHPALSNTLL